MTPEQEQALAQDGDGYHQRNYAGIGTIADPAFEQMQILHQVSPIQSVLEVGCTTGFRLEKARKAFGAQCSGIEISPSAVAEGLELYPEVELRVGAAPRDLKHWAGKNLMSLCLVTCSIYCREKISFRSPQVWIPCSVTAGT